MNSNTHQNNEKIALKSTLTPLAYALDSIDTSFKTFLIETFKQDLKNYQPNFCYPSSHFSKLRKDIAQTIVASFFEANTFNLNDKNVIILSFSDYSSSLFE